LKLFINTAIALSLTASIANAQEWNVDVFAGSILPNALVWNAPPANDTFAGQTYGIGISKSNVFIENLEIGFELSQGSVAYVSDPDNTISGLAVMVTAKYNFYTDDGFEAYGGVGLGGVEVTYYNDFVPYTNRDFVAGGQIMLGARYAVTDRIKVFAEARYLDTFSDPMVALNLAQASAEYNATNFVMGIRTSF